MAETGTHRRLHDVSPRDTLDRVAFVVAFIAGSIGSIILKNVGVPALWVAGFAAAVLVAYALVAWMGGRIRLEPETIGDNCYYLGFLFTLASLAYTLYQMNEQTLADRDNVDIPAVISGFGVALSSTIVGVFLRVLLMQLRTDFVTKDREVRADVNRAFNDFKKSMSAILRQMKAFSVESVQMAAERDKRVHQATETAITSYLATTENASKAFSKELNAALKTVVKHLTTEAKGAVINERESSTKALQEVCEDILAMKNDLAAHEVASFDALDQRRARLAAQFAAEEAALQARTERMDAFLQSLDDANSAITTRMLPSIEALTDRLDTLNEKLGKGPGGA